jgi:WD40 repeat protein
MYQPLGQQRSWEDVRRQAEDPQCRPAAARRSDSDHGSAQAPPPAAAPQRSPAARHAPQPAARTASAAAPPHAEPMDVDEGDKDEPSRAAQESQPSDDDDALVSGAARADDVAVASESDAAPAAADRGRGHGRGKRGSGLGRSSAPAARGSVRGRSKGKGKGKGKGLGKGRGRTAAAPASKVDAFTAMQVNVLVELALPPPIAVDHRASLGGGSGSGAACSPHGPGLFRALAARECGAFASAPRAVAPRPDAAPPARFFRAADAEYPSDGGCDDSDSDGDYLPEDASHDDDEAPTPVLPFRAAPLPHGSAAAAAAAPWHASGRVPGFSAWACGWAPGGGAYAGPASILAARCAAAGPGAGWAPRSAVFTSSVASAPASAEQKVLDVRFSPLTAAVPQLVAACNRTPRELLLYTLAPGQPATSASLGGHTGGVQDVHFAAGGTRLVSAASGDLALRVWDSAPPTTSEVAAARGGPAPRCPLRIMEHPRRRGAAGGAAGAAGAGVSSPAGVASPSRQPVSGQLSQLAVCPANDCIVASIDTRRRLLLWRIEPDDATAPGGADSMEGYDSEGGAANDDCARVDDEKGPQALDALAWAGAALEHLAVGTDGAGGRGKDCAAVRLYDAQRERGAPVWAASAAPRGFVAALAAAPQAGPACGLLASGGGDGTVCLGDVRCAARGRAARLRVASAGGRLRRPPRGMARPPPPEVTALAFSPCGRLLAAGATHNRAVVYDLRGGRGDAPETLHVLSHGAPGRVVRAGASTVSAGACDPGDQGINALAFLPQAIASPCLATAGGTGVALWDAALAAPCVAWMPRGGGAHSRTVNALAVHASGEAVATGGDDQRVVLYAPRGARWIGDLPLPCAS